MRFRTERVGRKGDGRRRENGERKSKSVSGSKQERDVQGWTWRRKEDVMAMVSCGRPSEQRSRAGDSTQRPFGSRQGRVDKGWIPMAEARGYQPHRRGKS